MNDGSPISIQMESLLAGQNVNFIDMKLNNGGNFIACNGEL